MLYTQINSDGYVACIHDVPDEINQADFIAVDHVPELGSRWDGTQWLAPAPPEAEPVTILSKYLFRGRLTLQEQMMLDNPSMIVEILASVGVDDIEINTIDIAMIGTFAKNLETAEVIDLTDANLQQGLQFLVTKGIISDSRRLEIITP